MDRYQKTVARAVAFSGKGLHSGRLVRLEILPAPIDSGITFQRTDVENGMRVRAHASQISSTELNTTIGQGPSSVSTIEHLMAALGGLGIDNVVVKLNGPEVPIMDGSAAPFVRKLLEAGLKIQAADRRVIRILKPFEIRSGDQFIAVKPALNSSVSCSIDFKRSVIGYQKIEYRATPENFLIVSDARTFCHINDVNLMRQQGLALGGSLDNAVVVTDTDVMNEEGLRGKNEFVRHKLLDLIGDLYLLGGPVLGEIVAHKPGHALHARFMREFLALKDEYFEIVPAGHLAGGAAAAQGEMVPSPAFAFG